MVTQLTGGRTGSQTLVVDLLSLTSLPLPSLSEELFYPLYVQEASQDVLVQTGPKSPASPHAVPSALCMADCTPL